MSSNEVERLMADAGVAAGRGTSGGEVIMNMPHEGALRQAEILAMRQMSDAVSSLATRFDKQQDKQDHVVELIGAIRTDIAVMKTQQEDVQALQKSVAELTARLSGLENRNAKQDGAATFITWMKDFGPWLFGLIALAYSLFGHDPAPPKP